MSGRTGPHVAMRAAATYVATGTWYAVTAPIEMRFGANALMISCASGVSSPGEVEFYLQISDNGAAGTYNILTVGDETPEILGKITFAAAAENRAIIINGLPPGTWVKPYFRASANAGGATLAISGFAFKGAAGSSTVTNDVGDVEVAVETIVATDTSIVDDAAFTPGTTRVTMIGYTFDDATPDSVDEGDGGAGRMSANRVPYSTIRDAAGNERGLNIDASNQALVVDGAGNTLLGTIDGDTSTIAGDTTSLDTKAPALGTAAMAAARPVTIATDDTMLVALDAALDIVAGDTTSLDAKQPALGTAAMAASSPVTIATDDTMFVALDTAVDIIAGDTTSLDAKQPALGTAAMAAASPVTIATDDTMFVALDTALDIVAGDTTSLDAKVPALGTAAMAASSPVTIATDDTMFVALDTAVDIIAGDTTSLDAKVPALGTAAMAASSPVTIATDDTMFVALDTAVDIIAGDTTSLDTKTPTYSTNRGAAAAGCIRVVEALDRVVTPTTGTGSGAIATTAISANFDLVSVTILFSAALAAAETVTISLDALDGVAYDAVLDVVDVGTSGETSYSFRPNAPIPCESGDEIVVTLSANTLTRTYGCRVVTDTR